MCLIVIVAISLLEGEKCDHSKVIFVVTISDSPGTGQRTQMHSCSYTLSQTSNNRLLRSISAPSDCSAPGLPLLPIFRQEKRHSEAPTVIPGSGTEFHLSLCILWHIFEGYRETIEMSLIFVA